MKLTAQLLAGALMLSFFFYGWEQGYKAHAESMERLKEHGVLSLAPGYSVADQELLAVVHTCFGFSLCFAGWLTLSLIAEKAVEMSRTRDWAKRIDGCSPSSPFLREKP